MPIQGNQNQVQAGGNMYNILVQDAQQAVEILATINQRVLPEIQQMNGPHQTQNNRALNQQNQQNQVLGGQQNATGGNFCEHQRQATSEPVAILNKDPEVMAVSSSKFTGDSKKAGYPEVEDLTKTEKCSAKETSHSAAVERYELAEFGPVSEQ